MCMLDAFVWLFAWGLTLVSGGATLYYGAVITGMYKDPLMANFRVYGQEHRLFPICRFLEVLALFCVTLSTRVTALTSVGTYYSDIFPPLVFLTLAAMAFAGSFFARRSPALRETLPRWYFDLLDISTRQERRLIGFAWLKIPRKMRWRLNGDQQAFQSWVDTVRITVIYGARSPDDPWRMWT